MESIQTEEFEILSYDFNNNASNEHCGDACDGCNCVCDCVCNWTGD